MKAVLSGADFLPIPGHDQFHRNIISYEWCVTVLGLCVAEFFIYLESVMINLM